MPVGLSLGRRLLEGTSGALAINVDLESAQIQSGRLQCRLQSLLPVLKILAHVAPV
jgi:hypothetical protein